MFEPKKEARQGRDRQRYNGNTRQVARPNARNRFLTTSFMYTTARMTAQALVRLHLTKVTYESVPSFPPSPILYLSFTATQRSLLQVVGCVPIKKETGKILLITQRKNKDGWVLPKGGWEDDETDRVAAQRETFEEAGAVGMLTIDPLGQWDHQTTDQETGLPKATFIFFEMEVEKLEDEWPEMNERERSWFTYDEAIKVVAKPFMREIIKRCSLAQMATSGEEEEGKDTRIWQLSVVLILFTFIVLLLLKESSYSSVTDEL